MEEIMKKVSSDVIDFQATTGIIPVSYLFLSLYVLNHAPISCFGQIIFHYYWIVIDRLDVDPNKRRLEMCKGQL
jgi:hypothetical protein